MADARRVRRLAAVIPGGYLRWAPVLVSAVVLLAVGLVVVSRVQARYLARGLPPAVARMRGWATVGVVVTTVPWLVLVLTPLDAAQDLRLVPLRDLTDIVADRPLTAFFQIVGNLLVFAGLGFCGGLGWRTRLFAAVGIAAAMSVTVETLQYVLALGRVSSSDDVLLNTAGAGLAFLIGRHRQGLPAGQ